MLKIYYLFILLSGITGFRENSVIASRTPSPDVHPAMLDSGRWVGWFTDVKTGMCDFTLYIQIEKAKVKGYFSITFYAHGSPEVSAIAIDTGTVTGRINGDRADLYLRQIDSKDTLLCLNGYCKSIAKNYRDVIDDRLIDTTRYRFSFYGTGERPVKDSSVHSFNAGSFLLWNQTYKFGE